MVKKSLSIQSIRAREILDSRGNPTVEATVTLKNGMIGTAAVPSGASTGIHEALELRDGGKRYGGKGVLKAVGHVNTKIAKALPGMDVTNQSAIDATMLALDGTENKSKLGANTILAVSMAVARAASHATGQPLYRYLRSLSHRAGEKKFVMPYATMNIVNGGRHADSGLSIQEFMIVPKAKTMAERVRWGAEVFHALKGVLKKRGQSTLVGDEGGFAPSLGRNEQAVHVILEAIKAAGYKARKDMMLASDFAASEFYDAKKGTYAFEKDQELDADGMANIVETWNNKYPFESIEDPFEQDGWADWSRLTARVGKRLAIVGDDFLVTNIKRLRRAIDTKAANAILIKLNQIGSLSETLDTIREAHANGWKISISHRSGETRDTFIADLAVAVNAEYIKTGSLSRSERVEKYNRLMQIESEVNQASK